MGAVDNSDIQIISTNALPHFEDDCHYAFDDGYQEFGKRIFDLIDSDMYGETCINDPVSPTPISVYWNIDNTLVVETLNDDLSISGFVDEFMLHDSNADILDMYTVDNLVVLELSDTPEVGASLSYVGPPADSTGNHVYNSDNLEMVCFYKMPISKGGLGENELIDNNLTIYPNPVKNTFVIQGNHGIESVQINDMYGKVVYTRTSPSSIVNVQNLVSGIYLVEIKSSVGTTRKRIIKQ
jgi:Secretion system C-terminal sorting domain